MFNIDYFQLLWVSFLTTTLGGFVAAVGALIREKTRTYILGLVEQYLDYSLSGVSKTALYWWHFYRRREQVVPLTKLVSWSLRPSQWQRTKSYVRMLLANLSASYSELQLSLQTLQYVQARTPDAATINPLISSIEYNTARIYSQEQEPELYSKAKIKLDTSIELEPNNLAAINLLSEVEYQLGDYKKSAHYLERLLHQDTVKNDPNLDLVVRNRLFYVYRYQGHYRAAEEVYLNLDKNNKSIDKEVLAEYYNYIAILNLIKGRTKDAYEAINDGLNLLGITLSKTKSVKASTDAERSLIVSLGLYYYLSEGANSDNTLRVHLEYLKFLKKISTNNFRNIKSLFNIIKLYIERLEFDNAFKLIKELKELQIKYFAKNEFAEAMINYTNGNFYLSLDRKQRKISKARERQAEEFFQKGNQLAKTNYVNLYLTALLYKANLYFDYELYAKSKKIYTTVLTKLEVITESFESGAVEDIKTRIGLIDKIMSKKNHPDEIQNLNEIVLMF